MNNYVFNFFASLTFILVGFGWFYTVVMPEQPGFNVQESIPITVDLSRLERSPEARHDIGGESTETVTMQDKFVTFYKESNIVFMYEQFVEIDCKEGEVFYQSYFWWDIFYLCNTKEVFVSDFGYPTDVSSAEENNLEWKAITPDDFTFIYVTDDYYWGIRKEDDGNLKLLTPLGGFLWVTPQQVFDLQRQQPIDASSPAAWQLKVGEEKSSIIYLRFTPIGWEYAEEK
jgi:hypothetical protein